ncbi:class I SAM-dependent methyltransferase [Phytomonospora sp. NPDC050363]|uniref:class I SAM-dependent methyltransferase n=1 Tax=Phytomonospora sp. NPDC050363 TaxID=3155642 RepID=UPI0033E741D8
MSEPSFLTATRASYDATAYEYVDMIGDSLDSMPLARALFGAFAELVRTGGGGMVADVGCGPGHVTALLHGLGLDVLGVDLSPEMIALARRLHPGPRYEVGSMLALDLPDASLGGLLAYYSIIHIPRELRAEVFAEFRRVLAPGGQLMLGFQVGDDTNHRDEVFGKPVNLDWHRQRPEEIAVLLREAGFEERATVVSPPEAVGKPPHCHLLAYRPGA